MSYTCTDHQLLHRSDPPPDQVAVASGSWFEALCGASGLAIVVLGMLGHDPAFVAAIATIVMGFGVFARAGTTAARGRQLSERDELLGISIEIVAGLAGIAIGVLVVLHVVPFMWLPLAAIALGTGLLFAGHAELGDLKSSAWPLAVMMLFALAALVLALLAFAAVQPFAMLSLAAIACVGAGLVLVCGGDAHDVLPDLERR